MKERPFDITLDGRFCIRLCIDWHKTGGLCPLYDIILSAYMELPAQWRARQISSETRIHSDIFGRDCVCRIFAVSLCAICNM